MAGATMQWIRDGLKLIDDAGASEALAEQTGDDLSVYLVPLLQVWRALLGS